MWVLQQKPRKNSKRFYQKVSLNKNDTFIITNTRCAQFKESFMVAFLVFKIKHCKLNHTEKQVYIKIT